MDVSECNSPLFSRYPLCDWIFSKMERNRDCLSLLSHSLFLNRDGRIVGAGRVQRVMRGGGGRGKFAQFRTHQRCQ